MRGARNAFIFNNITEGKKYPCVPLWDLLPEVCRFDDPSPSALIPAADGRPGIRADRGSKFLQLEPRAWLVGADLERDALTEHVDGELEVLDGRRAERERLLRLRGARRIGETGQRQVPCSFDK